MKRNYSEQVLLYAEQLITALREDHKPQEVAIIKALFEHRISDVLRYAQALDYLEEEKCEYRQSGYKQGRLL